MVTSYGTLKEQNPSFVQSARSALPNDRGMRRSGIILLRICDEKSSESSRGRSHPADLSAIFVVEIPSQRDSIKLARHLS